MMRFNIPNPEKNEKVILMLRRHPFVMLVRIAGWALAALLPFLFYLILGDVIAGFLSPQLFGPIMVLFTSIFYLYIWLFMFSSFVDYYLDAWILTNERIINIEQKGLFDRVISEQRLYRVQDITSELKGIIPTLLNYGNVYIQTAGEEERFAFKQVPAPYEVVKKINTLVEENKKVHHIIGDFKDKVNGL